MNVIKTKKGCLSILSGRSGMGKSTISVFNAAGDLHDANRVVFLSYEYCQSIIYNKLVEHFGLKWQELFNLDVCTGSYMPLSAVEEMLEREKSAIDILYIDYLDLLRETTYPEDKESKIHVNEHNQEIVAKLAELATRYNIAIVLLAQHDANLVIDEIVKHLSNITEKVSAHDGVIKMFIESDSAFSSKFASSDVSNVFLIDGYNLKHFSSINIKEAYKY